MNLISRFWAKVNKRSDDECWEWTASTVPHGYGQIKIPNQAKNVRAHRLSAMIHFGMFDTRLNVNHRCDNRLCVNPRHLYLGNQSDNVRDQMSRHRHPQVAKTHCPQGHPYEGGNLYISPRGDRGCRTCRSEQRKSFTLSHCGCWCNSYVKRGISDV